MIFSRLKVVLQNSILFTAGLVAAAALEVPTIHSSDCDLQRTTIARVVHYSILLVYEEWKRILALIGIILPVFCTSISMFGQMMGAYEIGNR